MVFRSAWIPAPPPESEPATVKTRGTLSKLFRLNPFPFIGHLDDCISFYYFSVILQCVNKGDEIYKLGFLPILDSHALGRNLRFLRESVALEGNPGREFLPEKVCPGEWEIEDLGVFQFYLASLEPGPGF